MVWKYYKDPDFWMLGHRVAFEQITEQIPLVELDNISKEMQLRSTRLDRLGPHLSTIGGAEDLKKELTNLSDMYKI